MEKGMVATEDVAGLVKQKWDLEQNVKQSDSWNQNSSQGLIAQVFYNVQAFPESVPKPDFSGEIGVSVHWEDGPCRDGKYDEELGPAAWFGTWVLRPKTGRVISSSKIFKSR